MRRRILASLAKSGGWRNPYVTDGLIAMWDGIWSGGWGVHSDTAMIDLLGGGYDFAGTVSADHFIGAATTARDFNFAIGSYDFIVDTVSGNSTYLMAQNDFCSFGLYAWSYQGIAANKRNSARGFNAAILNGGPVALHVDYDASYDVAKMYANGEEVAYMTYNQGTFSQKRSLNLGGGRMPSKLNTYGLRIYDRTLTDAEVAANYAVDVERFGLT